MDGSVWEMSAIQLVHLRNPDSELEIPVPWRDVPGPLPPLIPSLSAEFTMTSRRLQKSLLVAAVLLCTANRIAHATETDTASVMKQLKQSQAAHSVARKQVALKKAAAEIGAKQIEKLRQQLADAEAEVAADKAAMQTAEQEIAKQTMRIAALQQSLQLHRKADQLVSALATARQSLDDTLKRRQQTKAQQQSVQNRREELQQLLASGVQQKTANAESVKKRFEELADARKALEDSNRAVATQMEVVKAVRKSVTDVQPNLDAESKQTRHAFAAVNKAETSLKALLKTRDTIRAAAEAADMDPETVTAELDESIGGVEMLVAKAKEVLAAAKKREAAARAVVQTAKDKLSAARQQFRKQQSEAANNSRAHFQLQLMIADLQNSERRLEAQTKQHTSELEESANKQRELVEALKAVEKEIADKQQNVETRQKAAEAGLREAGRLVSFSDQIAPILVGRCVGCHSDRNHAGELHLDSLAGLLQGGKSGSIVDHERPETSLLLQKIASGAMPRGGEALKPAERQLVQSWLIDGAINDTERDATTRLFDVIPEQIQPAAPNAYRVPLPVTSLAFHPDGSSLATAGQNEILIWDVAEGNLQNRIGNVAELVNDMSFSPDGKYIAVAASIPESYGEVKLISVADGNVARTLLRRTDSVLSVAFSPSNESVAIGLASGELGIANLNTGDLLSLPSHKDWITDVNWSADGSMVVTACRDHHVRVFEARSGKRLADFDSHTDAVYSAQFNQSGEQVVSVGSDNTARVFSVSTGEQVRTLSGFGSDVFQVRVTPQDTVLTASADRIARSHSLTDGSVQHEFVGHQDWVYSLDFHAEKKLLATGSYDGQVRLWNIDDGRLIGNFVIQPGKSNVDAG